MLYLTYMWHACHMYDMYVAYMSHMWHIYNIHVIYVTCYLYVAYMTHIWYVFHIWLTLFRIYAIHGHDISRIYVFQICRIYVAYTIHIWYTYESYMKHVCDIYVTSHVSDVIYANIVHIDQQIWQHIWHTEHICSIICVNVLDIYVIYCHMFAIYVTYMAHICDFRMGKKLFCRKIKKFY